MYVAGRKSDAPGDVMSPATGRDSCWSYSGRSNDPLTQSRHDSVSQSFTRAQSLFMGLESASEVPIEIRNCWSTIEDDALLPEEIPLVANGGPNYPGNSSSSYRRSCGPPGPRGEGQEDDSSENALLAIARLRAEDRTGGSSGTATGTGKHTTEPSDFFSFGSEDMSDAGGTTAADSTAPEGVRGISNNTATTARPGSTWTPVIGSVATPGSSGRANGGTGTAGWNKFSDPHQSPLISVGLSGPGVPPGSHAHSLGANTDENAAAWGTPGRTAGEGWHCNRSHATALEGLPSHMRGSNNGNQIEDATCRSTWGSPACLLHSSGPGHAHTQQQQQQQQQALNGSCAANYAAALRSAAHPGTGGNASAQPHSPTGAKALTNEAIHAHLDTCGREVHSLLTPTVLDAVCDAVRRAATRLNAPGLLQVRIPICW